MKLATSSLRFPDMPNRFVAHIGSCGRKGYHLVHTGKENGSSYRVILKPVGDWIRSLLNNLVVFKSVSLTGQHMWPNPPSRLMRTTLDWKLAGSTSVDMSRTDAPAITGRSSWRNGTKW